MEFESNAMNKAQLRKKRRKKERMQAIAILAGLVLVIVLVLGIGIAAVVHVLSAGSKADTETAQTVDNKPAVSDVQQEDASAPPEEMPQSGDGEPDAAEPENAADGQIGGEAAQPGDEPQSGEPEEPEDTQQPLPDRDALLEEKVESQIASMSIEEKVAQLFFLTPEQLMGRESSIDAIGSEFNEKLNQYPVGGIVLRKENMKDADSLSSLISNLNVMAHIVLFVGVTDEGGENSPFVQAGITESVISSQKEIGESLGIAGAYSAGISLGSELKQYGFNVNFAPLADVSLTSSSVAARDGFGVDAQQTADLAKNVVKGLSDQNIYSTVKYFPSYGDVSQDGGSGQPISQRSRADLQSEAQPYLDGIAAGADFVMISHVSLPKVRGDNRPASLSKEIITDIVREEWQFDGIVITDYMDKSCIYQKYTYAEAAVGAIEAGADMILSTKNFEKSYNGILDAVNQGTLTQERIDESLRRIFRVKFRNQL